MPCLHDWGPQTRAAYQGPWEHSSPTHCPEQAQPWGQTRSLRSLPFLSWQFFKDEDSTTSLVPSSTARLPSWGKPFPYCQAEHLLFQSMTIASHPPAVCCSEEPLSNLLIDIGGQESTERMGLLHGSYKQDTPCTGSTHNNVVVVVTVTGPSCNTKQGEVTCLSRGLPKDSSHKHQEIDLGALWCSSDQNGLICHWVGPRTSKVPSNLHDSVIDHFRPGVCILVKKYWK